MILIVSKYLFGTICSYSYAYGTNEINIYWDYYYNYPAELLGCNIWRYETDPTQSYQVNQELITSPDKNFYYLDSANIIDSVIYFYKIEFVFQDDTLWHDLETSSFENIEFNEVGLTNIELIAVPKIQGDFVVYVYFGNGSIWTLAYYMICQDTFDMEINPYELGESTKILYRFYDFAQNCGSILTSASHLKELLLTQTLENKVPELSISNYPNPFTKNTKINVDIGINDNYVISIFDNKGSLIRILEKCFLQTGNYCYSWDRKNENGIRVPSGMYNCLVNSNRSKKSVMLMVQ